MVQITNENFDEQVLRSKTTVLLDFWAPWCGPCLMIAPILEQIAQERKDVVIGKINVEDEGELAVRFGIVSIPTLVVMRHGEPVSMASGYMSKAEIEALLK